MTRDEAAAPSLPPLAGVDGCRDGWLVLLEPPAGPPTAHLVRDADELFAIIPSTAIVAVDIPIGLPERGPRGCDVEARRFLGRPRGASVFAAPVRGVLDAPTFEEAVRRHRAIDGRGLSRQSFHLLPRIADVDRRLRVSPDLASRVREVHPEVAFALLRGAPIVEPKRSRAGRALRAASVEDLWPGALEAARRALRGAGRWAEDDLLDAFAVLWSARRLATGHARFFPARVGGEPAERDACGLAMEIAA